MTGDSDLLNCILCFMHDDVLKTTVQSFNDCLKHNGINLMDLKMLYLISKQKYILKHLDC